MHKSGFHKQDCQRAVEAGGLNKYCGIRLRRRWHVAVRAERSESWIAVG
jgi:hypothetical protein